MVRHHVFGLVPLLLLEVDGPGIDDGLPAELELVNKDHPASGDSSGGGHQQVLDLEHHGECNRQLDPLSVRQAQHPVVIEDGVHVLDPDGVDRPVE